jgi:uncharacterized protein
MNSSVPPRSVIAIMAKEPVAGRAKTRLSPALSLPDAARLSRALLEDTIALVSSVRGPRLALAISPPAAVETWGSALPGGALLLPVQGPDIGACLLDATGRLFAAGFTRVLALNSDSPTLPSACLESALVLLGSTDVVLGPSDDGGYYLVGLRRPCPGLFCDISWSSARVRDQTLARAQALGCSTALLQTWYDVDTPADLDRLVRDLDHLPGDTLAATRRFLASVTGAVPPGIGTGQTTGPAHASLPMEISR